MNISPAIVLFKEIRKNSSDDTIASAEDSENIPAFFKKKTRFSLSESPKST